MLALEKNPELARQHAAWKAAKARMGEPLQRPVILMRPRGFRGWSGVSGPGYFRIPWAVRGTMRAILEEVSDHYRISIDEMKSDSRKARITFPRQVAMWRMSEELHRAYAEIGRFLNRDHTTVLHAVRKIDALIASGELTLPEGWGRAG